MKKLYIYITAISFVITASCSKYESYQLINYDDDAPDKVIEESRFEYNNGQYQLSSRSVFVSNKYNITIREGLYVETGDYPFYAMASLEIFSPENDSSYIGDSESITYDLQIPGRIRSGTKTTRFENETIRLIWNPNSQDWENSSKWVYDSVEKSSTYYLWNRQTEDWTLKSKSVYTILNEEQSEYLEYIWYATSQEWVLSWKEERTRFSNGYTKEKKYSIYSNDLSQWVYSSKTQYEYDQEWNQLSYIRSKWDLEQSAWYIESKTLYTYIFENDMSLRASIEESSIIDDNLIVTDKTEYSYDNYGNPTFVTIAFLFVPTMEVYYSYHMNEYYQYFETGEAKEYLTYYRNTLDENWELSGKNKVRILFER